MINAAYRFIATFSFLVAFCVGALLLSGFEYAKQKGQIELISNASIMALPHISTRDL